MGIAGAIFNRFFVLEAFSSTSGWELSVHELRFKEGKAWFKGAEKNGSPESLLKGKNKHPFALVLHGHGIISKSFGADNRFVAGITANKDEFLSHSVKEVDDVRLTFMRRELYDRLFTEIAQYKPAIVSVRICRTEEVAGEIMEAGEEFYRKDAAWRNLVQGSACGDMVNNLIFKKMVLPVLVFVLAVLVANLYVSTRLRERIGEQKMVINAMNRGIAERDERQREAKQVYDRFSHTSVRPPAFIADRIASNVIAPVILNSITINPLQRRPAEDTPPLADMDAVIVKGESISHTAVTKFAENLRQQPFVRSLQLSHFELNRDNTYVFEITVRL